MPLETAQQPGIKAQPERSEKSDRDGQTSLPAYSRANCSLCFLIIGSFSLINCPNSALKRAAEKRRLFSRITAPEKSRRLKNRDGFFQAGHCRLGNKNPVVRSINDIAHAAPVESDNRSAASLAFGKGDAEILHAGKNKSPGVLV